MRYISILLFFAFISEINSQVLPDHYESMMYQAVARDAAGNPIINQTISLRFQITGGASLAYEETQSVTTDERGLFTAKVGDGTPTGGFYATYGEIDWKYATGFGLAVAADFTGGTAYQGIGWSSLQAMPFASISREAEMLYDSALVVNKIGSKKLYSDNGYDVGIGTDSPETDLDVFGNMRIAAPGTTTSPSPSASLDMGYASGALLLPWFNNAERDALLPAPGMIIYNSEERKFQGFYSYPEVTLASSTMSNTTLTVFYPTSAPFCTCLNSGFSQVFRPTVSGTADLIRVYISGFTNITLPPLTSIAYKVVEGTPDNPGAVLATTTVTYTAANSPGIYSIGFSPAPVLSAGQPYHINIAEGDLALDVPYLTFAAGIPGGLASGNSWSFSPDGPLPAPCCSWQENTSTDLAFDLVSITPEGWVDLH